MLSLGTPVRRQASVTECTGGCCNVFEEMLTQNYESYCDPRLNYAQSLEMAFLLARRLHATASSARIGLTNYP